MPSAGYHPYGCAARNGAATRPGNCWPRSGSGPRPWHPRASTQTYGPARPDRTPHRRWLRARPPAPANPGARARPGGPSLRTCATRAAVHAPRARFRAHRTTARAAAIPLRPRAGTKTPGACGPPRKRCADGGARRPRGRPARASRRSASPGIHPAGWVFVRAAGKQSFAQSRQEHDVEHAPAHFIDAATNTLP
jgi:hypothetical protein